MSVLFFWVGDNYQKDMKDEGKTYNLNQNSELMIRLEPGDHIWAFTRREDKTYVIAADLVVTRTEHNPPGYKYGRYRAWGDPKTSRYFDVRIGPDAESTVKSLSFYPPRTKVNALGQLFQGFNGVRLLSSTDEEKLRTFSSGLRTLR